MPLYRALRALSRGERVIPKGAVLGQDALPEAAREALLALGKIAPIAPPPLGEVPGWKLRAAKLAAIGVADAAQFLEADDAALREALAASNANLVRWRAELTRWLTIPEGQG